MPKPEGGYAKLQEVGALWEGRPGSALAYSGEVTMPGGAKYRLVIFKNKYKQPGDKKPALRVNVEVPDTGADETQVAGDEYTVD